MGVAIVAASLRVGTVPLEIHEPVSAARNVAAIFRWRQIAVPLKILNAVSGRNTAGVAN
jgi:hypothetical protein